MEIKNSLTMPRTSFEMRGNLNQKEPVMLKNWADINLYQLMIDNNKGKPLYMLHDGPPYANGDIHVGHALNKILKDFIIRYKNMSGFYAPYVPGWDTHGLPIESVLAKKGINRKEIPLPKYRDMCRDYALSQVATQKKEFIRLGSLGEYDNPYLTLKKEYEAEQIKIFGKMALRGLVYKGVKPVYWSPSSESSLAEAEIEYYDVTSSSIYVAFKVKDTKGILNGDESFVIWTTTPWTIPANLAICLNERLEYGVYETNRGAFIFLASLVEQLSKELGLEDVKLRKTFRGKELEGLSAKHPLYDRDSVIICGDHVTEDAGTGCVHTAPGHGDDDFIVGRKYNLDVLCPVDEKGFMMKEAGKELEGLFYEKANGKVIELLKDCGALLKETPITHSYPHDWRTKKPIIFRATAQWFVSINPIKDEILEEIKKVKWYPSWGEVRLSNMIKDRFDWCISRQRAWGVPLPIIYCEDETPIIDEEVFNHYVELFKEFGSNVWFEKEAIDLLPRGYKNPHSPNGKYRKETDIMDVWFDSGSSHTAVSEYRGYGYPVDLYLEGSDQYRGWFNSSLIIGVATHDKAPYKTVVSHGFSLDNNGIKQSKSLGNVVDPNKVCNVYGADILRLWSASIDYQADMRISDEILKHVAESYRKIRNTMRFLIGNLSDGKYGTYDDDKDRPANLELIDNCLLHRFQEVVNNTLDAYDNYDFNAVTTEILNFMSFDLSSFYLDITKDILYCEEYDSLRRRQVQATIYTILNGLLRLLTPIIPFTMEEAYKCFGGKEVSSQLLKMCERKELSAEFKDAYDNLLKLRSQVNKALEEARSKGLIGSAQEARVSLEIEDEKIKEVYDKLSQVEKNRLFIVSDIKSCVGLDAPNYEFVKIKIEVHDGQKCLRCWNRFETLNEDGLCKRCAKAFERYQKMEE